MSIVPHRPAATREEADTAITVLVRPPEACPGCLAEAGQPWPEGTTSRFCPHCVAHARRVYQCQRWNTDPAHQSAAGHASYTAFSARWRAGQGLPPLTVEAVCRYVTPEHIRAELGILLPSRLQETIYRAWCAGVLLPVAAWLSDDPPPEPDGLWALLPVASQKCTRSVGPGAGPLAGGGA
jgi:hypothetical protein